MFLIVSEDKKLEICSPSVKFQSFSDCFISNLEWFGHRSLNKQTYRTAHLRTGYYVIVLFGTLKVKSFVF